MGPWSEQRQLERLAAVSRLLEQQDLSDWARNYWSGVLNTIARDEARYNARVVSTWREIRARKTRNWMSYE